MCVTTDLSLKRAHIEDDPETIYVSDRSDTSFQQIHINNVKTLNFIMLKKKNIYLLLTQIPKIKFIKFKQIPNRDMFESPPSPEDILDRTLQIVNPKTDKEVVCRKLILIMHDA